MEGKIGDMTQKIKRRKEAMRKDEERMEGTR